MVESCVNGMELGRGRFQCQWIICKTLLPHLEYPSAIANVDPPTGRDVYFRQRAARVDYLKHAVVCEFGVGELQGVEGSTRADKRRGDVVDGGVGKREER